MFPLLIAAATLGAPALKDKAKPVSIAGEWTVLSSSNNGVESRGGGVWTFTDDGKLFLGKRAGHNADYAFTVDTKARPMRLQLTPPGGDRTPYACIFKVEGDALTVALRGDGTRPETLDVGPNNVVWRFERAKASKP